MNIEQMVLRLRDGLKCLTNSGQSFSGRNTERSEYVRVVLEGCGSSGSRAKIGLNYCESRRPAVARTKAAQSVSAETFELSGFTLFRTTSLIASSFGSLLVVSAYQVFVENIANLFSGAMVKDPISRKQVQDVCSNLVCLVPLGP